jgi:hypothetical protein
VKRYWEIIADKLSKAGWSWGSVSGLDSCGQTIWIATHIVTTEDVSSADEKLTQFLELERAMRESLRFQNAE